MIFCISGKLFASLLALILWAQGFQSPYVLAFIYGILPIWLEVIASALTGVEPSRQKNLKIMLLDNAVDALSFILLPSFLFYHQAAPLSSSEISAVIVFSLSGLYRLLRFVRTGLVNQDYFEGLPVTYTGYQWPLLTFFSLQDVPMATITLLLIMAIMMNLKTLKIKASR